MNKPKEDLNVYYDEKGDILEMRVGKPTPAYMKDRGNDIFKRIEEKTGKVKGISILNFKKRTEKLKPVEISFPLMKELTA